MTLSRSSPAGLALSLCVMASLACGGGAEPGGAPAAPMAGESSGSPRNPFGLASDVADCCGADVQAFADEAPDLGGPDDPNAEPWAGASDATAHASIEGEWAGRWRITDQGWTQGKATIRIVGDRVFIHYTEANQAVDYLIEAERRGDRLLGRYIHLGDALDTSPWVGVIVDDRRIDGAYLMGRWDFRRADGSPGAG